MTTRVTQGTLNRILTAIVVSSFPALNVSAPYMGDNEARLDVPGPFSEVIGTATGIVTSPAPYVVGTITFSLLRTQGLSASWIAQAVENSDIGDVVVYPDTSTLNAGATFPPITVHNCVINNYEPRAFNGRDPTVDFVIRGAYWLNNAMWSG